MRILRKGRFAISVIGQRIKELRQEKGMTQEELGAILGVQKSAVQKIESGTTLNLRADKIRTLCEAFNVHPSHFLYESPEEFWEKVFQLKLDQKSELFKEMLRTPALRLVLNQELGIEDYSLLIDFMSLNQKGVDRIRVLIRDLVKIKEYRRDK